MNHTLELVLLVIAAFCAVLTLFGVAAKINLVALGLLLVSFVLIVPLIR